MNTFKAIAVLATSAVATADYLDYSEFRAAYQNKKLSGGQFWSAVAFADGPVTYPL